MLCTPLGHFIRYMVLYFLSMEHMCSFMHYVLCTSLACRVQERTLHTAYWSLLQETIWISTGEPTPRMNEAFFTKSKAAVKLHCTAMFHLSVDDCAPFRLIIEPPALARDYFNMYSMSGRQYLRRKHLGLRPLNPL